MSEVCTICSGEFDIELEGGTAGFIGILAVAFCPTCHAGIHDYCDQTRLPFECPICGYLEDDDE